MKIPPAIEAKYMDEPEESLRQIIGELHENLVRLKEEMKVDPVLVEYNAKIKERVQELYRPKMKRIEINLEAARSIAKMRGIKYDRQFDN